MKGDLQSILCLFIVMGLVLSCNQEEIPAVQTQFIDHPRILLLEGEEEQIRDLIASDMVWEKMHSRILEESEQILSKPTLERVMVGRRLLATSRELLKRVFYLSYAYRMTDDRRFMVKAREEMVAVSNFYDWNPSHFLDVAEMTMGLAIGYDWLYDDLSGNAKFTIKNAIVHKGLVASQSESYNWFLDSDMNWNQVCNAGMVYGALAVQEDHPELAKEIIDRAFKTLSLPLEAYEPDGVYPEGYVYWRYGSSFHALLLSAISKVEINQTMSGTTSSFIESGQFMKHMIGPTGKSFNWGDCSTDIRFSPALFWFADQSNDPSILWAEKRLMESDDYSIFNDNNILPSVMIWGKNIPLSNIATPKDKFWMGQGPNPVALMRNSWTDPNAMYLGFKAGTPGYVHAHMDVGSFILEADGVRWAADLGKVVYEDLESLGMHIFGSSQNAQRWTVFRMSTYSHNVLIVDNLQQRVDGYAMIDKQSDNEEFMYAVSDISSIYDNQLKKAVRGVGIVDGTYTVVKDEVETLNKSTRIRWNMVTYADVQLDQTSAILSENGKVLRLKVKGPDNLEMKTWSTAPIYDYDPENPGTIMVGFECEVPANTKQDFEVLLVPEEFDSKAVFLDRSLAEW